MTKKRIYSLRKTSLGVGSVLLGFALMGANAQAEELNNEPEKLEWVSNDLEVEGSEVEIETVETENTGIEGIDLDAFETPVEAQLKEGSNTLNFKVSSDVSTTTIQKNLRQMRL